MGFRGRRSVFRPVEFGIQQGNRPMPWTTGSVGLQVGGSPGCN